MFALILQVAPMPMAMGSSSGWATLAGMIIRPRAISLRTSSGFQPLPARHVRHLLGDDALAGVVHLRHVRLAPTLLDPIGPHLSTTSALEGPRTYTPE